mmetsp:Transcript_19167/g.35776  ORF Transcript_19167/g.35776 Transcript_19167/m.35776 type:complete len:110 (+) Transcript_19167:1316-1645(+)
MNRVSRFASRENGGCGGQPGGNGNNNNGSSGSLERLWSSTEQSAMNHAAKFLMVSMLTSFVLGSILTCCIMGFCRRRPRRRQRFESELVVNVEQDSSEFAEEEPDVVID